MKENIKIIVKRTISNYCTFQNLSDLGWWTNILSIQSSWQKKALSSLPSTRDVLPFLVPFIIYVSVLIPATDQNISYFLSPSTKIIKIYHKKSKIQSLIGWFEVTWHVHILQTILSSHILSNISVYKFITLTLPLQPI